MYSFLVIVIGCTTKEDSILVEVSALTTNKKRQAFLEKIYKIDQKTRKEVQKIEVQHGYDSKERKEALQRTIEADQLNLQKIALYLEKFGHPTIEEHGE